MPPRTPGAGQTNVEEVTDPAVTDDESKAFDVGSRWINTVTGVTYECVDNSTGAAVWVVGGAPEASQVEVEAGTVTEPRFMTPQRVKQAIDALVGPPSGAAGGDLEREIVEIF